MKSGQALIDEIRNNHYTNTKKEAPKPQATDTKPSQTAEESNVPKKRRRRCNKSCSASSAKKDLSSGMFTITIVGGIGLPGYPLKDGEKLAIAKLTPIAVGT